MTTVLSFDLGASSGIVMRQDFNGETLSLKEVHRFVNGPIEKNSHYYWNFDFFMKEIIKGIQLAEKMPNTAIDGMGFDTWGVDFGLVNANGKLVTEPFSYRDTHTIPFMEKALEKIDAFELFQMTGNEVASINSLFQLLAIQEQYPAYLAETKQILMTPNLIQFALTGIAQNEFSIASTSQLVKNDAYAWHTDLINQFFGQSLPLAPIELPHQVVGRLSTSIQQSENLPAIPVLLTPGHDTACALSALPIKGKKACFMSIGTWTLIGKEVARPVLTRDAFEAGFTNEGTSEGQYRFQRNGMGFWILQKLRAEWQEAGQGIDYEKENEYMRTAGTNETFIDLDDATFFNPASMETAIQIYCEKTKQKAPKNQQALIQCVIESMALMYAHTIQQIENITEELVEDIYIGGGGIQNVFICQYIANATGKPVYAGPVEASAIGNGLSQLRALGELASLEEGRSIVATSFNMKAYEPEQEEKWRAANEKFRTYIT